MQHIVTIELIEKLTHDTLRIVTDKPKKYDFTPGQATEMAINKPGWEDEKRPFTFTSLPEDPMLEFIIKTYPSHDGTTDKLLDLKGGDEVILHYIFGSITYRGPGMFIAGGAGITPFIAIFRKLNKNNNDQGKNKLVFANKTSTDIILKDELEVLLNNRVTHILSEEESPDHPHGFITKDLLEEQMDGDEEFFYVCGPPPMMESVVKYLKDLGVKEKQIVQEGW